MNYAFQSSETLAKRNFFIMLLTWDVPKTGAGAQKENKRYTKHAQTQKYQKLWAKVLAFVIFWLR